MHTSNTITLLHKARSTHAEVIIVGAINLDTYAREYNTLTLGTLDGKLVVESSHGKHHRFELVVAIRPLARNEETYIYFSIRPDQHNISFTCQKYKKIQNVNINISKFCTNNFILYLCIIANT
jgi:hypothetical protein